MPVRWPATLGARAYMNKVEGVGAASVLKSHCPKQVRDCLRTTTAQTCTWNHGWEDEIKNPLQPFQFGSLRRIRRSEDVRHTNSFS